MARHRQPYVACVRGVLARGAVLQRRKRFAQQSTRARVSHQLKQGLRAKGSAQGPARAGKMSRLARAEARAVEGRRPTEGQQSRRGYTPRAHGHDGSGNQARWGARLLQLPEGRTGRQHARLASREAALGQPLRELERRGRPLLGLQRDVLDGAFHVDAAAVADLGRGVVGRDGRAVQSDA